MKKTTTVLAATSLLLLTPQVALVQPAMAAAGDVTEAPLVPSKDGTWDQSQTGGYMDFNDNNFVGGSSDTQFGNQKTAIQFDLSPMAGKYIKKATLRLYVTLVHHDPNHTSSFPYLSLYGSSANIVDDTKALPAVGNGDAIELNDGAIAVGWKDIDVTDFVVNEFKGDKVATFELMGNPDVFEEFGVSPYEGDASLRPQLVIVTGPAEPQKPNYTACTTKEDTLSPSGLNLTQPAGDDSTVQYYLITNITNGRLYKNDGVTEIANNTYITAAEGNAGLKFKADQDKNSLMMDQEFYFNAQAATDNAGTMLSPAQKVQILVITQNDPPTAANDTLAGEYLENAASYEIPFSTLTANDSAGPNEEPQTQQLTVSSVSQGVNGTVSLDAVRKVVVFTPNPGYYGPASFQYKVQDNGNSEEYNVAQPISDPKDSVNPATVNFTIKRVANTPSVTPADLVEGSPSTSGLKITPNAADADATIFYKISGITGGTLKKSDGSVISDNLFITKAEGDAGLTFVPTPGMNTTEAHDAASFQVQAAFDNAGTTGLSQAATASITVHEKNDPPTAVDHTLSSVQEDSGQKIIPFADLLAGATTGPSNESGQTLTISAVGNAVGGTAAISGSSVIFTPDPNFNGTASFQFSVQDNGTTGGAADPKTAQATASFAVDPVADTPSVADVETTEDTPASSIIINKNAADGAEVTYFKISEITRGKLYRNDGTQIHDGDYIPVSDGAAGLRFVPNANENTPANGEFSFKVQAALNNAGAGISSAAKAVVTVHEVNDAPTATDDALSAIAEDASPLQIPVEDLLANDSAGPNESGQSISITSVGGATGGTVELQDGHVIFTPAPDFNGTASFTYTMSDNGTTNGSPDPQTATATVSFAIHSVADVPGVTNAETAEDGQTEAGLVLTRNAADGTDVQFFKITGITGGTLYLNDGTTEVSDGDFIPVSQGEAGLKFNPNQDANSPAGDTFSFNVQASLDDQGTGISGTKQAVITVSERNDAPTAADDILSAVSEDAGEQVISYDTLLANDKKGPSNENGQTLTITDVSNPTGGTVRLDSENRTVIFTPAQDFNGSASFMYTIQDNGTTNGATDPQTSQATAMMMVNSQPDVPSVTPAETQEDTQSTSGLEITRNASDGTDVQYFKITGIQGGTLYKNDGTTVLADGSFITAAEGAAGLKFTPDENISSSTPGVEFSFNVQAALEDGGAVLSDAVPVAIKVKEVNDKPTAADDMLTPVIENSGARTIAAEDLLANDSQGPADERSVQTLHIQSVGNAVGGTVVLDDSGEHVTFTPDHNFRGTASFEYTVQDDGTTNSVSDPKTSTATVSFVVDARSDAPSVTDATTQEDEQNADGLVIPPTAAGGASAAYFKISSITGGTLYQVDGQTKIEDGEYITVADGAAGLKFLPDPDANGTTGFGFDVQAAPNTDGTRLSDAVHATVTVSEVNDEPVAHDDTLEKVKAGTPEIDIPVADLLSNDSAGPANESGQTLSVVDVDGAEGGTVTLIGSVVKFQPDSTFRGQAKFTYTVRDNGTTGGSDDPKTATADVHFTVADENQPVITLNGDDTVYVLKGRPYVEPGYAADDQEDKDLTSHVVVTGLDQLETDVLGTYYLHYNVDDSSGNHAPEVVRTVQVVSNELSGLKLDSGTLTPAFDPGKTEYTATVPINTSKITLTPTLADGTATVVVNGNPTKDGKNEVKLNPGKNDLTIIVTAQGGETKQYHLVVTRQLPAPSHGNPGGDVRHADVHTGDGNGSVVQVDINRTTGSDGHVVDSVVMSASKADEVVKQAAADGGKMTRIVIDDVPGNPADQVDVNVSGAALAKMKSAKLGLVIEAGGSKITLSADELNRMSEHGEDLYFRVVPVRKDEEKKQVVQRVLDSKIVKDYAKDGNVKVVAQPMTIETNYASHQTEVMIPLTGITLPSDAKEREAFLRTLAVYVEHSDGEKVVENGTLVYDAAGNPVGVQIEVQKFSTFTVIAANVEAKTYEHYLSGYDDGTFHPNQSITRAELASILAKELKLDQATAAQAKRYPDVSDAHWASAAILELRAAGILMGDADGTFRPDDALTRAEIAVIVGKLKKPQAALQPGFADTKGHWASAVIAAVKQAGLMSGYEDGTFRPDQTLTRAEAVAVLNRLFDRPLLKNQQQATFPDVALTDWYAADVESAANDLRAFSDGRIEKMK